MCLSPSSLSLLAPSYFINQHEEERGSPLKGERDESNGSHSYKKVSLIDFVGTYEEGTVYAVKREYQR